MAESARVDYRHRPVVDLLARGQVEQGSPGEDSDDPIPSLLLTDGTFLLLTNGVSQLYLAS